MPPKRRLDGVRAAAAPPKRRRRDFTSIQEYEKVAKIGEGTYGVVSKARHRRTGETVAVKAVKALCAGDDGEEPDLRAFWREADLLGDCRGYPSVVELRDVARDDATGDVFLVMEYVGPSLLHVIEEERGGRPFSEDETRRIMRQLLRGAKMMHCRGVIHRDLKPGNILVNGQGDVKICDFGMAKHRSKESPHGEVVGTLCYNAPELLMGEQDYDERVDTWALGVVMAELLAGESLFQGEPAEELIFEVLDVVGYPDNEEQSSDECPHGELGRPYNRLRDLFPAVAGPTGRPALSEAGFAVLSGLLEPNPDKRMSAATALRQPWFADQPKAPAVDVVRAERAAVPVAVM